MALLEVTVKAKLKLDDDLVDSFKAQETEDQIRGMLDEGTGFSVSVKQLPDKPAAKPEAAQE